MQTDKNSDNSETILFEDVEGNYNPTEEEIKEYAIYLGMNPDTDKEFYYIAEEGLKGKLPDGWQAVQKSNGEMYYKNIKE